MGLIPGSKVLFDKYNLGMWVLKIINESGFAESTIALREEEAKKLITEDGCLISFESIN